MTFSPPNAPPPSGPEHHGVARFMPHASPTFGWPNRSNKLLTGHPVFFGVDPVCVDTVLEVGVLKEYAPNSYLTREGDAAQFYWLLVSGSVRVFNASPAGLEVTVQLFGAPAAWGENQLLHDLPHTENVMAVDRAKVLQIPKADFLRLIRLYPSLMMNVLRDASARLLIASQHKRAMAFLSVRERIAHLLLSYERMYGVPVEGGTMIRIRLSQADLARGLGVALKSVSRAFHDFIAEGVLHKRGGNYVVTNIEALRALAPKTVPGIDWVAGRRPS